ncbi:unnamed protein product [Pseudo-nitzschia multistriata]|uniref:Uncharacterized protein n=1 Tax=Pseudo-nitzschia multistriata TaxID=183589 RepID=A0A448Z2F5_9STRA|nr:unnamed protein product [Pseudo-nitzschia multistriata]
MNSIIENEAFDESNSMFNNNAKSTIEDNCEDQGSLVSALSGEDTDVSLLLGEEVSHCNDHYAENGETKQPRRDDSEEDTGTTIDATTLVSTTSSNASNYFLPHHKHNDSLCYSTTSSTCDTEHQRVAPSSYLTNSNLGSFQQAFPSSMFPGQTLLPPHHSKRTEQPEGKSSNSNSHLPSYYYYSSSYQNSTLNDIEVGNNLNRTPAVGSNVYQKRTKTSDRWVLFYDDGETSSLLRAPSANSWRGALKCFFSPRVVLTVLLCSVILFNLMRYGTHFKHQFETYQHGSNSLGGSSKVDTSVDYIKLETIGGAANSPYSESWKDDDSLSLLSKLESKIHAVGGRENENGGGERR